MGEKVKLLRAEAGLSQQELADRLGKAKATVSMIESGFRKMDPDELPQFAEALGVPEELFWGKEPWALYDRALEQVRTILAEGQKAAKRRKGAEYGLYRAATDRIVSARAAQLALRSS